MDGGRTEDKKKDNGGIETREERGCLPKYREQMEVNFKGRIGGKGKKYGTSW